MGWQPARAFGETDPPAGTGFPTSVYYTEKTSAALLDLDGSGLIEAMTPVAGVHAGALINVVKSGTNASLQQVASNPAAFASSVTDLMRGALNGSLDVVVSAGVQVAGQVVNALATVPQVGHAAVMVSQLIGAVFTLLGAAAHDPTETLRAMADNRCQDSLRHVCQHALNVGLPRSTVLDGPSPADLFRQSWFNFQRGIGGLGALPLNVSSIYVLLCGAETQGFGLTRNQNTTLANYARGRWPDVGIPVATQRRMWSLIKGIMSAVEQWGIQADPQHPGDQGRALFPLLQDIVRNEWLAGRVNRDFVRLLSDNMAQTVRTSGRACATELDAAAAGGCVDRYCNCRAPHRHVDLSEAFEGSVYQWQLQLEQIKLEKTSKELKLLAAAPSTGLLTVDPTQALSFAGSVEMLSKPRWRRYLDPVMIGGGALAASYLTYFAVRRFGPRKR